MARKRSSAHIRGRSGLAPASDILVPMSGFDPIWSASPATPDVTGIPGERLSVTDSVEKLLANPFSAEIGEHCQTTETLSY